MNFSQFFQKAQKEGWAIGQFNFSTLEQLKGILEAVKKSGFPIILGTSEGESKFLGLAEAVNLVKFYRKKLGLPIFLNLDHGKSFEYVKKAIDEEYDAVHFDGSQFPLNKNIQITKKVVKYARKKGILVEGGVGVIGGDLTNPEEAQRFVKETKVDSLAINIGSIHGIKKSGKNPPLNLQRLKEIKERTGFIPLVLHGGSGISNKDIKLAIKLGITKINVNTELRIAYTETLRKVLKEKPEEITPYKYMPKVIAAVQKKVEEKIKLFTPLEISPL